ncbi:MAG: lipopolysaccharide heptosyltransferase II [Deltaproteobacteria bacterium]|nr:lipopolysaccharide heptosyltransferase II [Deltaproteobacteria bacterium]
MQDIKNILIVKLSSIGDVVHSLPFLEVIKGKFPHARIDWVVEEASSQILKDHPAIDGLIVSRRKAWQKKFFKGLGCLSVLREAIQLLGEVRERRYDIVVDLQGLFRSGFLVGLSRGIRKIGMVGAREGGGLFLNEKPVPVDYEQHAADRYLEVAEYLGCDSTAWKGDIPVLDADKGMVDELFQNSGPAKRPLIAINPMARWQTKLWKAESFAALADRLCEELSCRIVFTGSGQDRAVIEEISEMMKECPINLAGRTSLKELAYLYSICDVLITTDTGPMHIAAAMGCRVIALFGPTDPLRTGPYGREHNVIRTDMECSPCFKKDCEHMNCMKQITVEKCFNAVNRFLNQDFNHSDKGDRYGH